MRWKATPPVKVGDLRSVRTFALFPTKVGDDWVWLEWYEVMQRFEAWEEDRQAWVDLMRRVIAYGDKHG